MKEFKAKFEIIKLDSKDVITTSNGGLIDGGENGDFDGEIVIPDTASLLD